MHAVWGVSQMDGVTMSEPHREAALEHARRLAGEGKMSAAHAEALRPFAAGAGVDRAPWRRRSPARDENAKSVAYKRSYQVRYSPFAAKR